MPWHVAESAECPASRPWACIKDSDGTVEGCHETEEAAMRQMAALHASEPAAQRSLTDVHVRAFATQLEMSEGQLFGRLVPFNVPAKVADVLPSGKVDIYNEGFLPGVFRRQMSSTEPGVVRRVELVHTHDGGLGYLGPAVSLDERKDGIYGEFRVLRSMRADVEDLLAEGIQELSIEFKERPGGIRLEDGVRWRTDAHLIRTALEAQGTYPGAAVLAYRDLDEVAAEQAAAEEAARVAAEEQAAADAAAEAARVAEEQAAEERRKVLAEADEFLAEAAAKQAELVERFG